MIRLQMKIIMEGLIATAVEKICVIGWEDAFFMPIFRRW